MAMHCPSSSWAMSIAAVQSNQVIDHKNRSPKPFLGVCRTNPLSNNPCRVGHDISFRYSYTIVVTGMYSSNSHHTLYLLMGLCVRNRLSEVRNGRFAYKEEESNCPVVVILNR